MLYIIIFCSNKLNNFRNFRLRSGCFIFWFTLSLCFNYKETPHDKKKILESQIIQCDLLSSNALSLEGVRGNVIRSGLLGAQ